MNPSLIIPLFGAAAGLIYLVAAKPEAPPEHASERAMAPALTADRMTGGDLPSSTSNPFLPAPSGGADSSMAGPPASMGRYYPPPGLKSGVTPRGPIHI